MVVTTRRRAAALKNSNEPEKQIKIGNDTSTQRLAKVEKTKPLTTDQKDTNITELGAEPTLRTDSDQDDSTNEDSGSDDVDSSDDDQDDSSDEDQDNDDNDDDDNDDDLDDLLNKAQAALREQQVGLIKLEDAKKNPTDLQFPKLQPGVSVDDELYIKPNKDGIAKLSSQTVTVVDSDDKTGQNTKALVSLKKIKQDIKPLSRKERQLEREKTAGKGWFDMPLAEVTPEIKRDLQILKMRHVLDRKRHYKKMGKGPDPKYFQMGTVIEGATEFFSSRINKKDRKRTFAEEIMSNDDHNAYYYRKYQESQERKSSGGKKHYKKMMLKRS